MLIKRPKKNNKKVLIKKSFYKKNINTIKNIFIIFIFLIIFLISIGFTEAKTVKNIDNKKILNEELLLEKDNFINDEIKLKFFTDVINDEEIAKLIIKYTKLYNVDTSLFVSIIKVESDFNPLAENKNKNGTIDRGLCQLNNNTFKELDHEDFFNPEKNIKNGVSFLKWCLNNSNKNIVKALAFYNTGFGNVKNKKVGETTLDYINKILKEKEIIDSNLHSYFTENNNYLTNL